MITTLLAKVREQFGLAPNASLSQISEAIDAAAETTTEASATEEAGADAGAETVEETSTAPAAEPETADSLTTEQVQEMIDAALATQAQAIEDLSTANAELAARLEVVEGTDADTHTSGKSEAVEVTDEKVRAYHLNPINQ